DLWVFEGPGASLEVAREGIAYARARGLTEMVDTLTESSVDRFIDTGKFWEALEIAAELTPRLETSGDVFDLIALRAVQTRILAPRGQGSQAAEVLEWLEPAARGTEDPQLVVPGLGSAALARARRGQEEGAGALPPWGEGQ